MQEKWFASDVYCEIVQTVAYGLGAVMSDYVESGRMRVDARLNRAPTLTGRQQRLVLYAFLIGTAAILVPQSTVTDQFRSVRVADQSPATPERLRPAVAPPAAASRTALMAGDKLKIEVFQKSAAADTQGSFGSLVKGGAAWGLRPELSGQFSVQEDGTVVLPILGGFAARDRSSSELGAAIVDSFRATFANEARVSVTIAERPPIYVVGAVKSPGSFRYEAGLTALHAIALSGGMERVAADQWTGIEVAREGAKAASAAQALKVPSGDLAIMRAERDGTPLVVPRELTALVGADAARQVVKEASERRAVRVDAFTKQRAALKLGVDVAEKNLALNVERLAVMTKGTTARAQRVEILQGFVSKGMSSQALLNQAQAELSESNDRVLTARSMMGEAEYKVFIANQELAKFDLDRLLARETAIATLEKEVVDAQASLKAYESIRQQVSPQAQAGNRTGTLAIEIVRKYPVAAVLSPADPAAPLSPGDLVRILDQQTSRTN